LHVRARQPIRMAGPSGGRADPIIAIVGALGTTANCDALPERIELSGNGGMCGKMPARF
jgi:hypothetical protein